MTFQKNKNYASFLFLLAIASALIIFSCIDKNVADSSILEDSNTKGDKPKNIIFMIGDGMALSQISSEVWWTDESSWFELFPYVGFQKTYSANDLITDSAAGATAFACGCKTTNTYIGMDENKKPCTSIAETCKKDGRAVGIVVSSSATHATPAAFLAHCESRAFTEFMAHEYAQTPHFDCLVAGGQNLFKSTIKDIVPFDLLEEKGYSMFRGTNFKNLPTESGKPFVQFVSSDEPKSANEGRTYLPRATENVCEYLKLQSEKGFFLLVEGSQIDWALHANDASWFKSEMKDFDKTVGAALQFAAKDSETLVIVTGDHECGGLGLCKGSKNNAESNFTTKLHTGALVPVLAFGPGAEEFQGVYENTDIYFKMKSLMGL